MLAWEERSRIGEDEEEGKVANNGVFRSRHRDGFLTIVSVLVFVICYEHLNR